MYKKTKHIHDEVQSLFPETEKKELIQKLEAIKNLKQDFWVDEHFKNTLKNRLQALYNTQYSQKTGFSWTQYFAVFTSFFFICGASYFYYDIQKQKQWDSIQVKIPETTHYVEEVWVKEDMSIETFWVSQESKKEESVVSVPMKDASSDIVSSPQNKKRETQNIQQIPVVEAPKPSISVSSEKIQAQDNVSNFETQDTSTSVSDLPVNRMQDSQDSQEDILFPPESNMMMKSSSLMDIGTSDASPSQGTGSEDICSSYGAVLSQNQTSCIFPDNSTCEIDMLDACFFIQQAIENMDQK